MRGFKFLFDGQRTISSVPVCGRFCGFFKKPGAPPVNAGGCGDCIVYGQRRPIMEDAPCWAYVDSLRWQGDQCRGEDVMAVPSACVGGEAHKFSVELERSESFVPRKYLLCSGCGVTKRLVVPS